MRNRLPDERVRVRHSAAILGGHRRQVNVRPVRPDFGPTFPASNAAVFTDSFRHATFWVKKSIISGTLEPREKTALIESEADRWTRDTACLDLS